MFTGIVQDQVTIQQIQTTPAGLTIAFSLPKWGTVVTGESVLLNGICSTVTAASNDHFTVDYMVETIRCTTVSHWKKGQRVHAEPAITPLTRLSGSIVSGHVDTVGTVQSIIPLVVTLPIQLKPYLFIKGSITIDGINLTISDCQEMNITIHLIPETSHQTQLDSLQIGDRVNVEADYIVKAVQAGLAARRA